MFHAYAMTFTTISEQMYKLSPLCTVSHSLDIFNMIFPLPYSIEEEEEEEELGSISIKSF